MKHFYNDIDGWFNFEAIYSHVVNNAKDNYHFVEIGAWLGKSTSYMAVEIANSGKKIKFDAIDTWEGSPEHKDINSFAYEPLLLIKDALYNKFLDNINPAKKYVNPIREYSHVVVENYDDSSLDFVFIDGAHDYDSVKQDIELWFPKIKKGGIIAGHDYDKSSVKKAVDEHFKEIKKINTSWIVKI